MTKTTVQQFSFITPLFSDTCRHTKNKSPRRYRLYFRCRMHCWWIFDFETDYSCFLNLIQLETRNIGHHCQYNYICTVKKCKIINLNFTVCDDFD
jgi:hypothetical protein